MNDTPQRRATDRAMPLEGGATTDERIASVWRAVDELRREGVKRSQAIRDIEVCLSEMAGTDPTPGLSWAAKELLKSDHKFWQLERKENSLEWKRRAAVRLAIQAAIASSLTTAIAAAILAKMLGVHI
jgi:hypothetical protein